MFHPQEVCGYRTPCSRAPPLPHPSVWGSCQHVQMYTCSMSQPLHACSFEGAFLDHAFAVLLLVVFRGEEIHQPLDHATMALGSPKAVLNHLLVHGSRGCIEQALRCYKDVLPCGICHLQPNAELLTQS